ncbi:chemotaxis protein methyltransferase CheR [Deferribacter desulfuricans SSM1]|uniref:protein-glutamate O-methyltransferase n=1 Tax=Deferribacter desulfuricans (strain DSM 14783 / JCM 11476 / NBRC 101012 / SSM1) TaxID=639282 RepID=D3PBF2_DEFDS|nr:protein-glutamate O-methyltransferase CheR [Deferribacter desulfuricans]BAI79925.1 chemotaxis protein methyltransferase CheR [Deferribacter desulfuricans SSM1]
MINTGIIKIKDDEFIELAELIYKHAGITFTSNKKYLLENRLSRLLHELNFTSFKDYIYYLKYNIKGKFELQKLINLVTINETYFFRERGQIDYLTDKVVPFLISKGKRTIKILSAACSTGEEPYSIAIALKEKNLIGKARFDLIGVDINTEVIKTAQEGIYRSVSFRGVDPKIISKYFKKEDLNYFISDEIKRMVRFMQGNLTDKMLYLKVGKCDVIFCRNVLIYFDVDTKKLVIEHFYNALNTPGFLFLGHSETINRLNDKFVMENFKTGIVYKKE